MTGSGTQEDPYIISDVNDLQAMENDMSAYYELANDIDASATVGWNGGKGFDPIEDFTGALDGKGHVIWDLYINRPNEIGMGLFDHCEGATLANLGIENATVSNIPTIGGWGGSAGILLATMKDATINNCYTTGSVTGVGAVGGLIGGVSSLDVSGTITSCYSTASVTGALDPTFPTNQHYIGGFIGAARGTISKCYATGDVYAPNHVFVGGFAGRNSDDWWLWSISDCYARGAVTGDDQVGGFIGRNGWCDNTNIYSTGLVSGNTKVGGLVGENTGGAVDTSFWDTETSGQPTSDGGTGKTTTEMKTKATFTDAGWDLDTIWNITPSCNNDYPCLLDVTPACGVPVVPLIISRSYALAREEL